MRPPMLRVPLLLPMLIPALGPAAVLAQDLSEQQLTTLFRSQIEEIRAARADPELGASRGLVLTNVAPAGDSAPVTVEAGAGAAPATGAAPQQGGLQLGAGAGAADGAPVQYLSLPHDVQVNYRVTFAFDSAAIAPDQKPALRSVCEAMKSANVQQFRIIGHTDASGNAAYNQRLSVLRAEEVERFFVGDCGITPNRLEAIGVGEQFPFDAKDPLAGINRRVEFQALS